MWMWPPLAGYRGAGEGQEEGHSGSLSTSMYNDLVIQNNVQQVSFSILMTSFLYKFGQWPGTEVPVLVTSLVVRSQDIVMLRQYCPYHTQWTNMIVIGAVMSEYNLARTAKRLQRHRLWITSVCLFHWQAGHPTHAQSGIILGFT